MEGAEEVMVWDHQILEEDTLHEGEAEDPPWENRAIEDEVVVVMVHCEKVAPEKVRQESVY